MKQKDVDDLILFPDGLDMYVNQHHPDFDPELSLLAIQIAPHLFTEEQIKFIKNIKELNSSFQRNNDS